MKSLFQLAAILVASIPFVPLSVYSQTYDVNSFSSQGFSLRIHHSPQVTIQNSTFILMPANISDAKFGEVVRTVLTYETVAEIEMVTRDSDIQIISAEGDSLYFPGTNLTSAKFLLLFDFLPDPSNQECQDYRIDAIRFVVGQGRTVSNAHPHTEGECRFILSVGIFEPVQFSTNGLPDTLLRLFHELEI